MNIFISFTYTWQGKRYFDSMIVEDMDILPTTMEKLRKAERVLTEVLDEKNLEYFGKNWFGFGPPKVQHLRILNMMVMTDETEQADLSGERE